MVRGVCAGDSKEISVKFLLKAFKEAEQKHGRVFFGLLANALSKSPPPTYPVSELAKKAQSERWPVWSLQGGLQSLPEALAEKAASAGVELFVESPTCFILDAYYFLILIIFNGSLDLEFRKDGSFVVRPI